MHLHPIAVALGDGDDRALPVGERAAAGAGAGDVVPDQGIVRRAARAVGVAREEIGRAVMFRDPRVGINSVA